MPTSPASGSDVHSGPGRLHRTPERPARAIARTRSHPASVVYIWPANRYGTSRIALSFKDPETDSLARQVASLTGETLTEAVRGALRLRLHDEQPKRGERPWDDAAIDAIVERFNALPVLDHRTDDEILGHDETGLPSRW